MFLDILVEEQLHILKESFNGELYLSSNDDVSQAGFEPFEHYINYGWKENRIQATKENEQAMQELLGGELFEHSLLLFDSRDLLAEIFAARLNMELGEFTFRRDLFYKNIDYHFYIEQLGSPIPRELLAEHYLLKGIELGIKPNRYFSAEDYASLYSDIAGSDVDPMYHFYAAGRNEGRLPSCFSSLSDYIHLPADIIIHLSSLFFDADYYLQNNKDVAELKIDPLQHYVAAGWKENRAANEELHLYYTFEDIQEFLSIGVNPALIRHVASTHDLAITQESELILYNKAMGGQQPIPSDIQYQIEKLEEWVDSDFYFTLYSDVATSNLSAVEHYCLFGWQERKDPSATFSTSFYLDDNPDVVDAAVNPLFHYVVAGQFERRYQRRPGGLKSDIIYGLATLEETKAHWLTSTKPVTLSSNTLRAALMTLGEKVVIAVSHDRYLQHTGGVQGCIGIEELAYQKGDVDFLHLAPYQPLPTLAYYKGAADEEHYLHLSLNGQYVGVIDADELKLQLAELKSHVFRVVLHALHGHSPEFLVSLNKAINLEKLVLWVHDYFTVCEGYNLLRNNIDYCGAPDVRSKACNVCVFGQKRQEHVERIDKLLELDSIQVIAPSDAAAKQWLDAISDRPFKSRCEMQVINHIDLVQPKQIDVADAPIKIAFIGYPSFHKGWADFVELKRQKVTNASYQFFHIGSEQSDEICLKFAHCSVTKDHPEAMLNTIKDLAIDYVYIPAPWPETFNIVCYEALAAGAKIITHPGSGNVADYVKSSGNGFVMPSLNTLIDEFETLILKPKDKTVYKMQYSLMSAEIEGMN